MRVIIPLDRIFQSPEIMADINNLLKECRADERANRDGLIKEIVNHFHVLHALNMEESTGPIRQLIGRCGLESPTLSVKANIAVVDAFVETVCNAMWPFLQTMGYYDTNPPARLTFLRMIGGDVYLDDNFAL